MRSLSSSSNKDKSKKNKVFSRTTFANGDDYEVVYKNGKKQGHGVYFCRSEDINHDYLADIKATG